MTRILGRSGTGCNKKIAEITLSLTICANPRILAFLRRKIRRFRPFLASSGMIFIASASLIQYLKRCLFAHLALPKSKNFSQVRICNADNKKRQAQIAMSARQIIIPLASPAAVLMRSRLRKRARIYHFSSFYCHTDVNLQPIVLSKDFVTCSYRFHIATGFLSACYE
ncbi:hypothetical protein [Pantoea piersonii]|uniref:hypothetical protein n=2 Tax=Pantoea TaxID=53335 RepID=UPI00289BF338|nr:hypothetical protein [Pantoea piersonii]